jgi:hypothetical protein
VRHQPPRPQRVFPFRDSPARAMTWVISIPAWRPAFRPGRKRRVTSPKMSVLLDSVFAYRDAAPAERILRLVPGTSRGASYRDVLRRDRTRRPRAGQSV